MDKKLIYEIAFWIVIIGAVDMGLYALIGGDADIINFIFQGQLAIIAQLFEAIVGISALYLVYVHLTSKKAELKK